jgi:fructokinase
MADVVKLSDEDASWLYPDLTADVVLDRLLSLGSDLAVMTMGAEGARLATSKDVVTAHAPQIDVSERETASWPPCWRNWSLMRA